MAKFSVGEVAVYQYDGLGINAWRGPGNLHSHNGEDCVITEGPWRGTSGATGYFIKFSGDIEEYGVRETSLRKKKPPEQPSAFSYDEIISMCNDKSITDIRPTERQVREGLCSKI